MKTRAALVTFAAVAALGLAGLAVSAARGQRWTAFSVGVSARSFASGLAPGAQACQGPIKIAAAAGGVEAWAFPPDKPGPPLRVTIRDSRGRALLATGRLPGGYSEAYASRGYPAPVSLRTRLSATLPARRSVMLCLRNVGSVNVTMMGSLPSPISGILTERHRSTRYALALVFLRPHSQSLFSILPTAFKRASLFRPGWVGAWTFWLLAFATLGAFGVAAVAVLRANDADGDA